MPPAPTTLVLASVAGWGVSATHCQLWPASVQHTCCNLMVHHVATQVLAACSLQPLPTTPASPPAPPASMAAPSVCCHICAMPRACTCSSTGSTAQPSPAPHSSAPTSWPAGRGSYGFVLFDLASGVLLQRGCMSLPYGVNAGQAELEGLVAGLEAAVQAGVRHLAVQVRQDELGCRLHTPCPWDGMEWWSSGSRGRGTDVEHAAGAACLDQHTERLVTLRDPGHAPSCPPPSLTAGRQHARH